MPETAKAREPEGPAPRPRRREAPTMAAGSPDHAFARAEVRRARVAVGHERATDCRPRLGLAAAAIAGDQRHRQLRSFEVAAAAHRDQRAHRGPTASRRHRQRAGQPVRFELPGRARHRW